MEVWNIRGRASDVNRVKSKVKSSVDRQSIRDELRIRSN